MLVVMSYEGYFIVPTRALGKEGQVLTSLLYNYKSKLDAQMAVAAIK